MIRKVGILGGSGFVGNYIIQELLSEGYKVKAINRTKMKNIDSDSFSQVSMNLFADNLYSHFKGLDCIIYNIGIIRELPRKEGVNYKNLHEDLVSHVIRMAEKVGVQRFLLMSANGVERQSTNYEKTKFNAEQKLIKSKLCWTIFRPSLIFGDPNGKMEFCTQLKRDMIGLPFPIPIFFKNFNIMEAGLFKMSPIHVKNVAQFFVKSISKENSNNRIYQLGGSKDFTWKKMIRIISKACNKKKWFIPIPVSFIKLFAFFFDRWSWFPITRDQLTMLMSGNVCDSRKHFDDFDIDEITFSLEKLNYLS